MLQGFLSTFSDSSNADIFITDVQGKTLLCSEGGNCIHTQQSIPDKIMKDVLNNGFVSTSNLGGIYPYSHFTVGVPVTSESGVQVGAVFTSTDALYLTSFRNDVLKMFLFAAIAALTISFSPWVCSPIKWSGLCGKWRRLPGASGRGISPGVFR